MKASPPSMIPGGGRVRGGKERTGQQKGVTVKHEMSGEYTAWTMVKTASVERANKPGRRLTRG